MKVFVRLKNVEIGHDEIWIFWNPQNDQAHMYTYICIENVLWVDRYSKRLYIHWNSNSFNLCFASFLIDQNFCQLFTKKKNQSLNFLENHALNSIYNEVIQIHSCELKTRIKSIISLILLLFQNELLISLLSVRRIKVKPQLAEFVTPISLKRTYARSCWHK